MSWGRQIYNATTKYKLYFHNYLFKNKVFNGIREKEMEKILMISKEETANGRNCLIFKVDFESLRLKKKEVLKIEGEVHLPLL